MNPLTRKKILDSIADCDRYIAKESPRRADLRPAKTAELLAWYIGHRLKLIGMLSNS